VTDEKEKPSTPLPNKAGLAAIAEKLGNAKFENPKKEPEKAIVEKQVEGAVAMAQSFTQPAGQLASGDGTLNVSGQQMDDYRKQFMWTPEQEKELLEAVRTSKNFDQVSEKLSRPKHAVRQKIAEMLGEKEQFQLARSKLLSNR
jgi:hypothetical protein